MTRSEKPRSNGSVGIKLTSIQRMLLEESKRKVSIRVDGKIKQSSLEQVLIQKYLETAVKGSPHALNQTTRHLIVAQQMHAEEIAYQVELGTGLKSQQQQKVDVAIHNNIDPRVIVPHPDDIRIDENSGYHIDGPYDDQSLLQVVETCQLRDVFILQHSLEERLDWPPYVEKGTSIYDEGPPPYPGSAQLWASVLERFIPERFVLSDDDIFLIEFANWKKSKRQLLKETHQAWISIGLPRPRGWKTQPFRTTQQMLSALFPIVGELARKARDGEPMDVHEINQRLMSAFGKADQSPNHVDAQNHI